MATNVYTGMKKMLIFILALAVHGPSYSQQQQLNAFNNERNRIDKNAFKILGAYSAANVIYGSIASSQTTGSNKYFHEMNAIWNGITLGISAIGYLAKKKEGDLSYSSSLKKQHATEKLFLFNAGLDLAYIAGGAYLNEKSKTGTGNPAKLKGYGQSVMLQGAVLLLFDGILYTIHNRHGKKLYGLADRMQLSATGNGLGITVGL